MIHRLSGLRLQPRHNRGGNHQVMSLRASAQTRYARVPRGDPSRTAWSLVWQSVLPMPNIPKLPCRIRRETCPPMSLRTSPQTGVAIRSPLTSSPEPPRRVRRETCPYASGATSVDLTCEGKADSGEGRAGRPETAGTLPHGRNDTGFVSCRVGGFLRGNTLRPLFPPFLAAQKWGRRRHAR